MAEDSVRVNVGLSVKVTNPSNQYENATFTRSITRTRSVAPPPEDADKLADYEVYLDNLEDQLDEKLRQKVEAKVQQEIDQYYADNSETVE